MQDTKELVALLGAALGRLRTAIPQDPGVISLTKQFDQWQRRHGPIEEGSSNVEVSSLLSHRTKEARVELVVNQAKIQVDLDKAREIVGMLQGAIEAAISDQLVYQFLTKKVGLTDAQASAALLDFRELRQGSRDIVNPS